MLRCVALCACVSVAAAEPRSPLSQRAPRRASWFRVHSSYAPIHDLRGGADGADMPADMPLATEPAAELLAELAADPQTTTELAAAAPAFDAPTSPVDSSGDGGFEDAALKEAVVPATLGEDGTATESSEMFADVFEASVYYPPYPPPPPGGGGDGGGGDGDNDFTYAASPLVAPHGRRIWIRLATPELACAAAMVVVLSGGSAWMISSAMRRDRRQARAFAPFSGFAEEAFAEPFEETFATKSTFLLATTGGATALLGLAGLQGMVATAFTKFPDAPTKVPDDRGTQVVA